MKLLLSAVLCTSSVFSFAQNQKKFNDTTLLQPVEVNAVRAGERAPFAKTNVSKKDIEKINLGQDLPFLLSQTPSAVVNSDAGAGVGYTGIRIRGTDASRINVTLNGIPYNDAESQGTYFVDLPDFASSVNSIQIQRGVGTSTNGAGAFGANINLSTNEVNKQSFVELNNSVGSYNTWKRNLQFGSGLLGKHFTVDGRISQITSDGYIERATSNLKSIYFTTAYVTDNNSLRFNVFGGKEKTYQAWDGVPESMLAINRRYNEIGTEKPGAPYDNETDNYIQTHYQLFYNHKFNAYWKSNIAVFYTKGKGYYEQYKAAQALADYGLPDYTNGGSTVTQTDLIRRLWLDNNFYGTIFSAQHQKNKTEFTAGGGWDGYDGEHFGEITWAEVQAAVPAYYRWYDLMAHKKDFSVYSKWTQYWTKSFQTFADLQYRNIHYTINGFEHNPALQVNNTYNFVNPKLGFTWNVHHWQWYASYALAQHEPNRDDFEAGTTQQPKRELLNDVEAGIERKQQQYSFGVNVYYMKYKDQLILTGKINDVGAYTRINVPNSYRAGIELQGQYMINKYVNVAANATFSQNKIKNFTEYIDDYDNGGQTTNFYSSTNIALSPDVIVGGSINIMPFKNASCNLISKYVGRQYLDNTGKQSRSLDPYYVQDVRLSYELKGKVLHTTSFIVQLNNIFSKLYEPSGYSYSYIYGGQLTTENYYYPMAPFNFMAGVRVRL
ncbi:MAG: TonB-dependent receptor plug domain-containing protein [Bacteroidetes bacterium]|nr:TonB-dependent receptor plug domain-containing protein [Bacteroidota bacterium]